MITIPIDRIVTKEQREATAVAEALATFKAERAKRLEATDWLVTRHRDETDASAPTTLTEEQYQSLLAYRQALRDLPDTTTNTNSPDWPVLPTF